MQTIAIIDYGSGNLRSAERAVEEAAKRTGLECAVAVTNDAELCAIPGMREAMEEAVRQKGRPFLGICVGMQLLAERGLEHGEHAGLGWIRGQVVELRPNDPHLKIPHMGWNEVVAARVSPLCPEPAAAPEEFYFVHSFVLEPAESKVIAARTRHGIEFCSMIHYENLAGVQFHPEKSQRAGLALLARFLDWRP
jgi:imidazole glycerol-phosphate synthase subunit HisH